MEKTIIVVRSKQQTARSKVLKFTFLLLLFVAAFTGCKTAKIITKPSEEKKPNPVVEIIEQVQKNQPKFKTANVSKMAMELEVGERKVNVSATCKIKKDSALYLSVQPFLGIEMFKAEFTTDSIKVFDKMNRRYYAADYSYFSNRFKVDIDFYSLQSLLTARFFCIGQKNIQIDSCRLIVSPTGQSSIGFDTKNMIQTTEISDKSIIQQVTLRTTKSNYQLKNTYTDYLLENGVNFPTKINLKISSSKINANCEFSILKVVFDTDITFLPTSSERFSHADLDQLLKK